MLLWADGFSWIEAASGVSSSAQLANRYSSVSGAPVTAVGELGRPCLKGPVSFTSAELANTPKSVYVVGFSLLVEGTAAGQINESLLEVKNGNNTGITIFSVATPSQERGDFRLVVNDSQGRLVGDSVGPFLQNQWYYIELKIDGTDLEIRVSGYTAMRASLKATPLMDKVALGMASAVSCDSLYVLDDAGLLNNDFLGPVSVDGLFALLEFENVGWTPVGGSSVSALRWLDGDTQRLDGSPGGSVSFRLDPAFRSSAGAIAGLFISYVAKDGNLDVVLNNTVLDSVSTTGAFEHRFAISEENPETRAPWSYSDMAALFLRLIQP